MKFKTIEEVKSHLQSRIKQGPGGCWLWQGATDKKGYALCQVNRRRFRTARLSFMAWIGPIPAKHDVHHVCQHRDCICPEHLRSLPHGKHMRKHSESGVWRGEKNGRAKITELDAQFIRLAGPLVNAQALADQHGLSLRSIYNIRSGRTWRHVGLPDLPQRTLPEVIKHSQAVARRAVDVLLNLQELRRERGQPQPPMIEESITLARACAGGI